MFVWPLIFFILAMFSALVGYKKPTTTFTQIAKLYFFAFIFIFFLFLFGGIISATPTPLPSGIPGL